ncbi:MAG: ChbG/HpnK family deacetylase, partial [Erysipelotrichaceae bacterium]|nr:ChbG/HpnK family deacetylase [Erysipelotrichaceae bacterium]
MKLLVQGDDFGFTRGVTFGIVDSIDRGVLRNTGLFSNMPSAELAVSFMKDRPQACFGIDFNLVSGPPVSDPAKIPHLVDENGQFIRSGKHMKDPRWQSEEGRREMFPYREIYGEIRAQYDRFVELTGGKPGYLHTHSLHHEHYIEAIRQVSAEEGVPFSQDIKAKYNFGNMSTFRPNGLASTKKIFDPNDQLNKNPLKDVL